MRDCLRGNCNGLGVAVEAEKQVSPLRAHDETVVRFGRNDTILKM
jgi:hypothetical protein